MLLFLACALASPAPTDLDTTEAVAAATSALACLTPTDASCDMAHVDAPLLCSLSAVGALAMAAPDQRDSLTRDALSDCPGPADRAETVAWLARVFPSYVPLNPVQAGRPTEHSPSFSAAAEFKTPQAALDSARSAGLLAYPDALQRNDAALATYTGRMVTIPSTTAHGTRRAVIAQDATGTWKLIDLAY